MPERGIVTVCAIQCSGEHGSPLQSNIYSHINKKQSGNNVLHFANLLPDYNFPFFIFNFEFTKVRPL